MIKKRHRLLVVVNFCIISLAIVIFFFGGFVVVDNAGFKNETIAEPPSSKQEKNVDNTRYYKVVYKAEELEEDSSELSLEDSTTGLTDKDFDTSSLDIDEKELMKSINEWLQKVDVTQGCPWMTEQQISAVKMCLPASILSYKRYGLFPSVMIGQFGYECGWGTSYGWTSQFNGFGIMIPGTQTLQTFPNAFEGLLAHGAFIHDNSIYAEHGALSAPNADRQLWCIGDAGYCAEPPHPVYYQNVKEIMGSVNAEQYDKIAQEILKNLDKKK